MTAWILNRPQLPLVILHDADEARTKTSNGSTIAEYPVENDAVCSHLAFRYICHFIRPGLVYSLSPKTTVTHHQTQLRALHLSFLVPLLYHLAPLSDASTSTTRLGSW